MVEPCVKGIALAKPEGVLKVVPAHVWAPLGLSVFKTLELPIPITEETHPPKSVTV